MKMPRTLYVRLGLVLLGVFAFVGVLFLALVRCSTEMHQQEVMQRLNRDLAKHVLTEGPMLEGRVVNHAVLKRLFHSMMVVNPGIEVYLLDAQGMVLTYSAKPGEVRRTRVNLGPIHSFLAGRTDLPILGDDPRNPLERKIFSAAVIGPADAPLGYMYIILRGAEYTGVTNLFGDSHILEMSAWVVGAGLLFTLLVALVVFAYLTRRLGRLGAAIEEFQRGDCTQVVPIACAPEARDEIDRLTEGFCAMMERMVEQVQYLRQTDTLRRELMTNVSHDLRTPLTALRGYLETLQIKGGDLSEDERHRYLEIATRHSERLGRLVDELFELAKLDAGVTPLQVEPFSLSELVQDTVQRFELVAQRKRVTLKVNYAHSVPFVHGDIGLIERILANLLDNALRHTDAGGTICIQLGSTEGRATVQVSDTGRGIAPEDLPYVFDRFFRKEPEGTNDGGAGLGLAIAQRIVELHGGRIEAQSVKPGGSIFHFDLPTRVSA